MTENISKSLEAIIKKLKKDFGEGAIHLVSGGTIPEYEVISTGLPSLDRALGTGGLVRGTITEIYGQESVGKTTLALQLLGQVQKIGLKGVIIDTEQALKDFEYVGNLGVDPKSLFICQPPCAEEALNIIDALVRDSSVGMIVLDSVAALTPRVEGEKDVGEATMGVIARLMGQALRKYLPLQAQSKVSLVFINQIRMKLGTYGNPETTCVTPETMVEIQM